ncbi:copper-binding protein [Stella sp.]|uniref:copper-binding protein n=1 Tax=Stella sp. TaxID=2912054 RepID=UPI0035B2ABAD
MRILPAVALAAGLLAAVGAVAQPVEVEGEVRRIDAAAAKMTIRHGPIAAWDMPPMTMVFRVADPAMLQAVRAGDKVRFAAERGGGAMTITRIEKVP